MTEQEFKDFVSRLDEDGLEMLYWLIQFVKQQRVD